MPLNFSSFKPTASRVNSSPKLHVSVQALHHKYVLSGSDLMPFTSRRVKQLLLIQGAGYVLP